MKYLLLICLSVIVAFMPSIAKAKSLSLVQSCAELVDIYESRDEKKFLASQRTSLSESFRAGYCRGVLEQHRASNNRHCSSDWYKRAKFIAALRNHEDRFSDSVLLKKSCDEY
ncbi:hypothetical protein [Ferrimonas gelatinilytica]|uniref:hypothetical protein n=1 Tax=Ferrimonas gelatinilytica TaxID=1255257 RepID=UPI0031EA6621